MCQQYFRTSHRTCQKSFRLRDLPKRPLLPEFAVVQECYEGEVAEYFSKTDVFALDDLKDKIKNERLPSGFSIIETSDRLMFIAFTLDSERGPKVSQCLTVLENLSFELYSFETRIPSTTVDHISPSGSIANIDDVLNILAYLSSYSSSSTFLKLSFEDIINKLCQYVELHDDEIIGKGSFQFAVEQLKLAKVSAPLKRYSPSLLAAASLWESTLYRMFLKDGSFSLPSVR